MQDPYLHIVIGGLLVATVFTLFFVPCVYAMIYNRRTAKERSVDEIPHEVKEVIPKAVA